MVYIALDIGGTQIKYGLVNQEGDIIMYYLKDTNAKKGAEYLLSSIESSIEELIDKCNYFEEEIKGIGVSTAGQVNSITGEIIFATDSIPGWTGVKLKSILENKFKYPCIVENDVNCTALGEMKSGIAKGEKNFLAITLGTGIGGAIVIDGKIFTGNNYSAGEVGHTTLYPNGARCTCGKNGCFERYGSTSALMRKAKKLLETNTSTKEVISNLNPKIIFDKAKEGEGIYKELLNQWTYDIALGLKNLVHIFNPSLIVIGGGVSAQGDYLINMIKAHLDNMIMPSFAKGLEIKAAQCGNGANIVGAVCRFLE